MLPTPNSPSLCTDDSEIQVWGDDHTPAANDRPLLAEPLATLPHHPVISVIMPVYNPPGYFLRAAIDSVRQQTYPHWQLCLADDASTQPYIRPLLEGYAAQDPRINVVFRPHNGHISAASNSALALATGDFIALVDHDDVLNPRALAEVVRVLTEHPDVDMIYSDEEHLDTQKQRVIPFLKPDWCPETFLSSMYTCHLGVYRRSLVEEIGGFRVGYEGSQDYDLVLRLTEQSDRIVHCPKTLYRWRMHPESVSSGQGAKQYAYQAAENALTDALARRGDAGSVLPVPTLPGYFHVRYALTDPAWVTLLIYIDHPGSSLAPCLACLESIFSQTQYPQFDVLLSLALPLSPEARAALEPWQQQYPDRLQILTTSAEQSSYQPWNQMAQQAKGRYLVFLDGRVTVTQADWIELLMEQAQRTSIAAAAGIVLNAHTHKVVQAGIILNASQVIADQCNHAPSVRNVSALPLACVMMARDRFEAVGGFASDFQVAFAEVDLCLKLSALGYRHVCISQIILLSIDGATPADLPALPLAADRQRMQDRWLPILQHDPCINTQKLAPLNTIQVSVIVPWWDHTEFLSLWTKNLTHLDGVEVIFIDNGSAAQGKADLETFCQTHGIHLIQNSTNRGFSAANNQGLAIATGDYVLFLNNDLEIHDLPLARLCQVAGEGMTGPGWADNELGLRYVEGWAMCVKRSALKAVGGWCEDYGPGYWDDVDVCYRLQQGGYPLTPFPDLPQMIHHVTNATGRDGRLDQLALHGRNRGIFLQRHLARSPKIIIDGVFFQRYKTGIARVWRSLLEEWAHTEFADHLVLLDRAGTAPSIPGIRSRRIPPHNYQHLEDDRALLQDLCDEEGASLFMSTYYTTPLTTPSVLMGYDMIPEITQANGGDVNLEEPMWAEKHQAIAYASAYVTISENTAYDLLTFFPDIDPATVAVAHCGVNPTTFTPASPETVTAFRQRYGIAKPYFLLVGNPSGYKNAILFYQALAQLDTRLGFEIIAAGFSPVLEPEFRAHTTGIPVHLLQLSDEELAVAYGGAIALVYPSKYEGFGMPIVEAMACGCPVITCATGSIPEVAGEAVLYVDDQDVGAMADALCEIQKPSVRQALITAGLAQAQRYSWSRMAATVTEVLMATTLQPLHLGTTNLILFPDWSQPEEVLATALAATLRDLITQGHPAATLLITLHEVEPEVADLLLSSVVMTLALEEGLELPDTITLSFVPELGPLQWQALGPKLTAKLAFPYEDAVILAKARRFVLENSI